MSAFFRYLIFHWCHCEIAMGAKIGSGFCIRHVGAIVIGGKTEIGKNCDIRQGVTFGGNMGKRKGDRSQPKIGDNVIVGAGAKILGPIEVGAGTIIGANAVVVKDVRPNSVVGGIPAREIHTEYQTHNESLLKEVIDLKRRLAKVENDLSKMLEQK